MKTTVWEKSFKQFVDTYLKDSPFAAFKHSQRQAVGEEAIACLRLNKDSKENILRTLSFLKSENFQDNCGLYEMTVFIKRHNDPVVIKTMNLWFQMNQTYSKRDQLTFTYCIWKTGLEVRTINLNVWDNQYFTHQIHNDYPLSNQCNIYYGSSNMPFDYDKFHTYKYTITGHHHSIKTIIPNDTDIIEINFASTPGIIVDNFTVKNNISQISFLNHTRYNDQNFFFGPHSTAIIQGDFKKNQQLSFSFDLIYMEKTDLIKIIETLFHTLYSFQETKKNIENILSDNQKILAENQKLSAENKHLSQELTQVLNSKAWRLACKIRKILYRKKVA